MDISGGGTGKSPAPASSSLTFRYNANNEELEELSLASDDEIANAHPEGSSPSLQVENASPKKSDKTSLLDKYFKTIRPEKSDERTDSKDPKSGDDSRTPPKEVSSSPMKDYLNRLGKRSTSESSDPKEVNETWKIFHDFKFKIAQAVEDMKTRSVEAETKEKSIPRDSSISDSEDSSALRELDTSVGDTENQVSSLDSSMQNLSELTSPVTAKATEKEVSFPIDIKNNSDSSDETHRNKELCETPDPTKDLVSSIMDIESGVEALEYGVDGFCEIPTERPESAFHKPLDLYRAQHHFLPGDLSNLPPKDPQSDKQKPKATVVTASPKTVIFTFMLYFLTFLLFASYFLFPEAHIWNGFLMGIWVFYFSSNLKQWVLDNYFTDWDAKDTFFQLNRSSAVPLTYTIPSVKEHRPLKKYQGWVNHYRYPEYDPYVYHITKTTTAFMKLEGCNLRISYTMSKIRKRALWDEKIEKVEFYQHRLYNLTGARVILLPKGLVRRRQWSKKYPICIVLHENENIQVLEKEISPTEKKGDLGKVDEKKKHTESPHDVETAETNTSPEKKRKFVWRRREKGVAHSEEVGKEGLRHRLVRKMHRDKKTDNVAEAPVPATTAMDESPTDTGVERRKSLTSADEEYIDENDLSRIKEFLEETEQETGVTDQTEGEWSVRIREPKGHYSYVFFFTRTGRDKYEWFRRISSAIEETREQNQASGESSLVEEKSAETPQETKDGVDVAVYKVFEKDTVAFSKTAGASLPTKLSDVTSDGSALPQKQVASTFDSYEKSFWPFLLKIIQTHEIKQQTSSDVGVTCQIEPTPRRNSKTKKKWKDSQPKNASPTCECRMLPAEVTWVNTFLARLAYDVMRNDALIEKLQMRVQKKLHTMKLPSFMSPLMVTELSLSGACPLVERVSAPAWDERGMWLDADLRYDGGAYITVLTQINLLKLKEKNVALEEHLLKAELVLDPDLHVTNLTDVDGVDTKSNLHKRKPAIYDSDMEDSAESSDDENDESTVQPALSQYDHEQSPPSATADNPQTTPPPQTPTHSSKKKFMRMVDRIASNKYFQQVTDYKYVKRAMEGLSNTDIKLQLQVQGLEGRLVLNLPAPPHDRLWFGFRTNPQLVLKARPAVGARALRFTHISNWIEQKLLKEFEKVLVMPNMEDFIVDLMSPTPVQFE